MAMWSTALERRRRGRGRPRQRGQSLVEFALVFPLFILLLAGMIDFGLGLYTYMTINNAARDAARLATTTCSTIPCTAAVKARVQADAPMVAAGEITVTCNGGACTAVTKPGQEIMVQITHGYKMIWPLAFQTQIPMTSTMYLPAE